MINFGKRTVRFRPTARSLAFYSVLGINPSLALNFSDEQYFTNGVASTFSNALVHSRAGFATMIGSDGVLKWAPHNLVLNSATPITRSITVIVGARYTVEITGTGAVTLSGAGTGSVTMGNPVSITASTTTLTLTVSGSVSTMWAYRSDLGGMAANPDTGNSYVPTTSTVRHLPRRGHHMWSGSSWVNEGILIESVARTNLLTGSAALATQTVTVTAVPHTLHFTGTGTVTLSGASTAGPLVGTGVGEQNRVSLTFTPTAGSLTLTVSGTVTNADLEIGSTPSSHKPTLTGTFTRPAETLVVPAAKLNYSAVAMSFAMRGRMTYADLNSATEVQFFAWRVDTSNDIFHRLSTNSTDVGKIQIYQRYLGVLDGSVETGVGTYSPGVLVPYSIAGRHGSTFIQGAVDGNLLTADLTPTALPNLSAVNLSLGLTYMGTIKQFTAWPQDIGSGGIVAATQ